MKSRLKLWYRLRKNETSNTVSILEILGNTKGRVLKVEACGGRKRKVIRRMDWSNLEAGCPERAMDLPLVSYPPQLCDGSSKAFCQRILLEKAQNSQY